MSFLTFEPEVAPRGWVTKVWTVAIQGVRLGQIRWWSPWRRYVFAPSEGTLFDTTCLEELARFCSTETNQRDR